MCLASSFQLNHRSVIYLNTVFSSPPPPSGTVRAARSPTEGVEDRGRERSTVQLHARQVTTHGKLVAASSYASFFARKQNNDSNKKKNYTPSV